MELETRDYGFPVDCIVDAGHTVVLCSYRHSDGSREGMLQLVDKESMALLLEIPSSGTLHAFYRDRRLYCADSAGITVVQDQRVVASLETKSLNTYISGGDYIYAASISGEIMVLDPDLKPVETIRVSREPVWVVKQLGDHIYFGDESGCCYRYDLAAKSYVQVGKRRLGILDIVSDGDLILVSSYDGNLEMYCRKTLELRTTKHTGPLWRVEKAGDVFVCACMYDGLKIFDSDFRLLRTCRTSSICYGLCIASQKVFWSSFYDNTVIWASLDKLLPEHRSEQLQNNKD